MAPNFPTSYDDKASLFVNLADLVILTLDGAHDDSVTTITFNEGYIAAKMAADSPLVFLAKGVGADTFTGGGLDDLSTGGTYAGFVKKTDYRVEIDGTGSPDTFKWSNDGGATWEQETIDITGIAQALEYGLTITFGATTGHTATDRWDWEAGFEIIEVASWDNVIDAAVADDGGSMTNETTAASNATDDDMTLLPAVPVVDDAYYFGHTSTFDGVNLRISTPGAGTWTIIWEYWDGDSWEALAGVIDRTSGFIIGGANPTGISFTKPGDWDTTTVNAQGPFYYVRARVSAYTSITTQPLGAQVDILTGIFTAVRAVESSTAMAHLDLGQATQDPLAGHFNRIRDALIAAERYKGLVGTSLPGTANIGESYIKTDTDKWYVCLTTDTWSLVNRPDHGEYGALSADDHVNLQIVSRKVTWHTALPGDHLTTPLVHDHDGSGTEGSPIKKFETGLDADKGTPVAIGQNFYGYDLNNLYFSANGSSWTRYTTMPEGTLMYYEGGCPTGWTTQTALDGKFLKGAPAAVWTGLVSGGVSTHVHDMPDIVNHQHSTGIVEGIGTSGGGSHHHGFRSWGGTGYELPMPWEQSSASGPNYDVGTTEAGGHIHTMTVPAQDSDNQGSATVDTDSAGILPAYKKLRLCRKD